jgi:hypothetical protein
MKITKAAAKHVAMLIFIVFTGTSLNRWIVLLVRGIASLKAMCRGTGIRFPGLPT